MELKPCPMCNEKLSLVGTSYMHLISDCILSQFHVNPGKFSAWNRRAESDLLAALKELVRLCGHSALDDDCPVCVATAKARAAIARHE